MRSPLLRRRLARMLYGMRGTGLPRLADALRRREAARARSAPGDVDVWIDDFRGALRFCCDLSEHMGSRIFFRGSHSGAQLDLVERLLEADSVFVDVGANQGEFTVCAAARVSRGRVIAFEPVPALRARLERNVDANGFRNVEIHAFGLSDRPRDGVPIFVDEHVTDDCTRNDGTSSLFADAAGGRAVAEVSVRTLDDMIADRYRVDLIKIDVEGSELPVLRGAEQVLVRDRPILLLEANAETCEAAGYDVSALFRCIEDFGYGLYSVDASGQLRPADAGERFANVLAAPPGRLAAIGP